MGHLDESDKEGKFTLIIFADGKQEKVITQNPEDPVTHDDVSINKADIIKIEWSSEKYADFGSRVCNIIYKEEGIYVEDGGFSVYGEKREN